MPYWRLHYHAIWACKNRLPLITPDLEPELQKYLFRKGRQLGAIMHAVGNTDNHVHTAFSLPPKIAIANFIHDLKGASSHWVSNVLKYSDGFGWQRGYGILSYNDSILPKVIDYVKRQKEHHRNNTFNRRFEHWSENDEGVETWEFR